MARPATVLAQLLDRPKEERNLGPYQLIEPLGKGAFAPVWLAKELYGDTELRTVAIKLFALGSDGAPSGSSKSHRSRSSGPDRNRIVDEARALCRVEHPNIVRFYTLSTNADETILGVVMEHVRGQSLDQSLAAAGKLPLRKTLAAGVAVASALAATHQAGLIHRDIKPQNVIDALGVYKLIDFGIAAADAPRRSATEADQVSTKKKKKKPELKQVIIDDLPIEILGSKLSGQATHVHTLDGCELPGSAVVTSGTIGYIDPASVMDRATPGSDLYSLGAMLFECVTGTLPAVAAAMLSGSSGLKGEVLDGRELSPPVCEVEPQTPEALGKLIDELLLPDPGKRPRSAEAVAWELERIRLSISESARPLPPERIGPFRGLGRFECEDRDVFFGRSVEIAASLQTLRSRGLLALVGPSGSGKSSLARAGVAPAVVDGGLGSWPKQWDAVTGSPGADPWAHVVTALEPFVPDAATRSPDAIAVALADRAQSTGRGTLLVVDQLEELVTLASGESQRYLVSLLARLGDTALPGVRCIAAARRDLLDPLLAFPERGRVLTRGTLLVLPMSEATWGDVLDQALEAYGYRLQDDALRQDLLGELEHMVDAMPLAQFALTELWDLRDRDKKIIPHAALEKIGGIAGALEKHAERTRSGLLERDVHLVDTIYKVVMALTTPQGTRAALAVEELEQLDERRRVDEVLATFEEARLLVREGDDVTLAHEALLSQWQRLRGWLAEAREDRQLAAELNRAAIGWGGDQADERLWRKRRLAGAHELIASERVTVSDRALAFVDAGRRAERRGKIVGSAIAAAVALVAAVGGVQYVAGIKAAQEATGEALLAAGSAKKQAEANERRARDNERNAKRSAEKAKEEGRRAAAAEALATKQGKEHKAQLSALQDQLNKARTDAELRAIQKKVNAALNQGASGGPTPAPTYKPPPISSAPADTAVGDPP